MSKKKVQEVQETEQKEKVELTTTILAGITKEGNIVHDLQGDKNIVVISGLIKYLQEVEKTLWADILKGK